MRPVLETFAAALFCGFFTTTIGVLMQWYYVSKLPDNSQVGSVFSGQYLLFAFITATLTVFVPLLLFNFLKIKFLQRKAKHVRA